MNYIYKKEIERRRYQKERVQPTLRLPLPEDDSRNPRRERNEEEKTERGICIINMC